MSDDTFWRRCSNCKREIGFSAPYWTCNVSTCNRKGSAFLFCAVDCWQSHVPTMRHRDAWAEEQRSPSHAQWSGQRTEAGRPAAPSASTASRSAEGLESLREPRRTIIAQPEAGSVGAPLSTDVPREILIVASKLKQYVKARSDLNTSDAVMQRLSDLVRRLCDDAVVRAREEGRKTLLDRDF